MKQIRETEAFLRALTVWEGELARGKLTRESFLARLRSAPEGFDALRWYRLPPPEGGGANAAPELDGSSLILSGDDVSVSKHVSTDRPFSHTHNFYEMIAVLDGTGRNTLADREDTLSRGQLFLLSPGTMHSFCCSADGVVLNVLIREPFFRSAFPALLGVRGAPEGLFARPGEGSFLLFDMGDDEESRELLLLLAREALGNRPNRRAAMNGALALLFSVLLDRGAAEAGENASAYGEPLRRILDYIASSCAEATIEGAAERLHFSTRHVSRILHESCGRSFTELLREARVAAACRLLEETKLPVEEIARAVGFSEGGYFIRVFRREKGVTPAVYRAQAQEKHNI